MPVHPHLQRLIDALKKAPSLENSSLEEMRQSALKLRMLAGEVEFTQDIQTVLIHEEGRPTCLARIYRPKREVTPMLLYFHPGGFVKGDIESHDPICRRLAKKLGAVVVSLNYRLAPEFKFPSQLQDAYAALEWIYTHADEIGGDQTHIGVAGESSGGNLAAVLSLMARDRKGPKICFQGLIYPQVDYTMSFPSHRSHEESYLVTDKALAFYAKCYLPNDISLKHPYVSPYFADDLKGLPDALIITAEFDALRDEAEGYGKKLALQGCRVVQRRFDGMVHGFFQMPALVNEADEALELFSIQFWESMHRC